MLTAALLGVTVSGGVSGEEAEAVQVELRQGVAKGVPRQAGPSTTFYSFRGLPYAKPPLGHLRFKVGLQCCSKHNFLIVFLPSPPDTAAFSKHFLLPVFFTLQTQ